LKYPDEHGSSNTFIMTETATQATQTDAEPDPEENNDNKKIGIVGRVWSKRGSALAYIAGGIVLYIAVTNLQNNTIAGILGILLGVVTLPVVRSRLPLSTRVLITRYGKVLVVIFVAIFSGAIVDPDSLFMSIEGLLGV